MFEKEAERSFDELDDRGVGDDWSIEESYVNGFSNGAEFGYKLAHEEIDYLNKHWRSEEERKANEWHKADVPTTPINKVVLGYIKDYNTKKFCLVKWNGEWWYDARTWNDKVKLIAWKEIVLPKENE